MTPSLQGWVNDPDMGIVRYTVHEVSDDPDTQVAQTIELMRQYAFEDSQSPAIRQDSWNAMQTGDPIEDTWNYISRKDGVRGMRFVHDEETGRPWGDIGSWRPVVETLIRPADQAGLSRPKGDCDDFAMYGAANLLSRGVPCSFCTVAADPRDVSVYSHVYLVAYPRTGKFAGRRVPLDLSHGWFAGWETENKYGKRREWPITGQPISAFDYCRAGFWIGAASLAFLLWKSRRSF